MTSLSPAVRQTLRETLVAETPPDEHGNTRWVTTTIAGYVRAHYPDGVWGGDSCGCPDDRCIGHHHDVDQDYCGCFDVLLSEHVAELYREHLATLADLALSS